MNQENNDIQKKADESILTALKQVAGLESDEELFLHLKNIKHKRRESRKKSLKMIGPYYRETYALAIKDSIDDMIATNAERMFEYSATNISRNSLYSKVRQAFMYLKDNMDHPDNRYAILWDKVVFLRGKRGVCIMFKVRKENLQSEAVAKTTDTNIDDLDQEIMNFLEDPEIPASKEWEVSISDDDVVRIKNDLRQIAGIKFLVKTTRISIIKLPINFEDGL